MLDKIVYKGSERDEKTSERSFKSHALQHLALEVIVEGRKVTKDRRLEEE